MRNLLFIALLIVTLFTSCKNQSVTKDFKVNSGIDVPYEHFTIVDRREDSLDNYEVWVDFQLVGYYDFYMNEFDPLEDQSHTW